MSFRLIQIFKWTTAIAVVLLLVMESIALLPLLAIGFGLLYVVARLDGRTDSWLLWGVGVGMAFGVAFGKRYLGEWGIDTFNPSLPRSQSDVVGIVLGVPLGAFVGATLAGLARIIYRRRPSAL